MNNNNTKNRLVILVACILLISISGCSSSIFKKGATEIKTIDYQKGKEGISIAFVPNSPPDQVYVGSKFNLGLQIENKGAYSIKGLSSIKIEGYEEEAYVFKDKKTSQSFSAEGKGPYRAAGETTFVTFPIEAKCFPWFSDTGTSRSANFSSVFVALACYYYETKADTTVCLDTMINRPKHTKAECSMGEVKLSGGQGGPVGVVSVAPRVIPYASELNVDVVVKIKKLSDIDIHAPDSTACGAGGKPNEVAVEVSMGGLPLTCRQNRVKVSKKEETSVFCYRTVQAGQGAFSTPVSVKLKYYVSQQKTKKISLTPPMGQTGEELDCKKIKTTKKGGSTTPKLPT